MVTIALTLCGIWWSASSARAQRDDRTEAAAHGNTAPPMDGYAFGVKVGFARVGTGDVRNPTYIREAGSLSREQLEAYGFIGDGCTPLDRRCRTEARGGVQVSIPLQLGGSIVGFRLEPYMTLASTTKAYGAHTGPTFEFHVMDPLYLGFGFGLQAAWVNARGWKYAADIYGRIPLRATYYPVDDFALGLEGAFGAGASGYVSELRDVFNPATGRRIARRQDVTFGFGRTWDLSIGIRFP